MGRKIKIKLSILLVSLLSQVALSQNLIPNGDFEDANICQELSKPCAPESWVSTTLDRDMYYFKSAAYASSGVHYAGLVIHDKAGGGRSFIRSRLLCGLRKDAKYTISFFVRSSHALFDSIGIVFSNVDFLYMAKPLVGARADVIARDTIHKNPVDPSRWYRVRLNYTANGTETFIALGSFLKNVDLSTRPDMKGLYYVFVDSMNMVADNPSELLCGTADSTKHQIYNDNARHTTMKQRVAFYSRDPQVEIVPPKTVLIAKDTFLMPDILFATGSAVLTKASAAFLDSVVSDLMKPGIDSVVVEGHTDNAGKPAANEVLSLNRAQSVSEYLVNKSTRTKGKFFIRGYGDTRPVISNSDAEGRRRNRRVVIVIYRKNYD